MGLTFDLWIALVFIVWISIVFAVNKLVMYFEMESKKYKNPEEGSIWVIDGNNAAGKTTKCKMFKNKHVFIEPSFENPHLDDFYTNAVNKKTSSGFKIEQYLIKHRAKVYKTALDDKKQGKHVVLDRSIFSSQYFIKANLKMGNLTLVEYNKLNDMINSYNFPLPDQVIYLEQSVDKCYENIQIRMKDNPKLKCEQYMKKPYLKNIETSLNEWFDNLKTKKQKLDWSSFGK